MSDCRRHCIVWYVAGTDPRGAVLERACAHCSRTESRWREADADLAAAQATASQDSHRQRCQNGRRLRPAPDQGPAYPGPQDLALFD